MSKNIYLNAFKNGLKPDKLLTVSQWADKYRVLPQESSSEYGQWRTSRTPYLREIMDELSPTSPTEDVIVIKGTQLGFTEAGNNVMFCYMDYYPCPILQVMPTKPLAEKHSNSKIGPSIKLIPHLHKKIERAKTKDDAGGTLEKKFKGGMLSIGYAFSPSSFASFSARITIGDDIDRFPKNVGDEGSPMALLDNRTDAFGKAKRYKNSSPTKAGESNIEIEYASSTQAEFNLPCVHCKELVTLDFEEDNHNFIFEYDHDTYELTNDKVYYKCPHCGELIEEHHKEWMMNEENGAVFVHKYPHRRKKGYRVNSFYSPLGWLSWRAIFDKYLNAKKLLDLDGDDDEMIVFVNTKLAKSYKKTYEQTNAEEIIVLKNDIGPGICPNKTFLLTMTVDVQKDHFWFTIRAWQYGNHKQIIRYGRLENWSDIEDVARTSYFDVHGHEHCVSAGFVDSGYNTQDVYDFCALNSDIFMPIKGSETQQEAFRVSAVEKDIDGKKIDTGMKLYIIKTSYYKDSLGNTIENSIKAKAEGNGKAFNTLGLHSETDAGISDFANAPFSFCRQLTSEYKHEEENAKGFIVSEWRTVTTKAQNHLFDCEVYQTFLGDVLGVRFITEGTTQTSDYSDQQSQEAVPLQEDHLSNY